MDAFIKISVTQFRGEITFLVHVQHAESAGRMVDTSLVQGSSRDRVDVTLFLYVIDMPVTVYPGFQVMVIQVNLFLVVDTEDKLVAVSQQVMIEYDNGLALRDLRQIVLQPAIDIFLRIARLIIAARHRSHNIMHATGIK